MFASATTLSNITRSPLSSPAALKHALTTSYPFPTLATQGGPGAIGSPHHHPFRQALPPGGYVIGSSGYGTPTSTGSPAFRTSHLRISTPMTPPTSLITPAPLTPLESPALVATALVNPSIRPSFGRSVSSFQLQLPPKNGIATERRMVQRMASFNDLGAHNIVRASTPSLINKAPLAVVEPPSITTSTKPPVKSVHYSEPISNEPRYSLKMRVPTPCAERSLWLLKSSEAGRTLSSLGTVSILGEDNMLSESVDNLNLGSNNTETAASPRTVHFAPPPIQDGYVMTPKYTLKMRVPTPFVEWSSWMGLEESGENLL